MGPLGERHLLQIGQEDTGRFENGHPRRAVGAGTTSRFLWARGLTGGGEKDWMESFFAGYEESYSLTLAYPREFFEPMAEAAGLPYEGRKPSILRL